MASKETLGTVGTKEKKVGIIVVDRAGSLMIGILGGKIVIIPPEDPSWGSIVATANAAAAVAKVEGVASPEALRFAGRAIREFSTKYKQVV